MITAVPAHMDSTSAVTRSRKPETGTQIFPIVIPIAPERMHGGRDSSCYENMDISK